MIRTIGIAAVAYVVAAHGVQAAPKHGSYITSACPYQATAIADGCAAANQNGNFTVQSKFGVSFRTHAMTSGQTWSSAHPWAFNAPGVDYPVGYDTTLTLKDPTNQSNLPTGATYQSANHYVYLTGTQDVVLNGFDFSVANLDTKTGVGIRNCLTGGAKFTLSNSYWKLGTAQSIGSTATPFMTTCTETTTGPTYILNNEFDGGYSTVGGGANSFVVGTSGSPNVLSFSGQTIVDIEYNYVHNLSSQVFNGGAGYSGNAIYTVAHNYVEGFSLQGPLDANGSTPLHGAILENSASTSNVDMGSQYEQYNVIVIPTGWGQLPITTTFSALTNSNGYNQYLDNLNVSNNIIVVNCGVSENPCNYQTNTATFTGGISGTTLTVGTVSTGTVQVGQSVTGSGITGVCACTIITANISGSGNGSTWTVSIPQTVTTGTSLTGSINEGTISSAVLEPFRLSYITNMVMKNNYADPHGAQACTITTGSAFSITGFVDDGLGGGSYDATPGFILTVTGYQNSGSLLKAIYPYQYVTGTGLPGVVSDPAAGYYVMPYGTSGTTGTGGAGTYKLASDTGGAIAVNGSGNWQTSNVPVGVNSRFGWDVSGNVNLIDGSAITPGGIQWNNPTYGSCLHTLNNS